MIQGDRIERLLAQHELSQSELARRVGVRQSTINGLIRGHAQGSKHLHKIARELLTTPAYLAGETDDPDADAPEQPELTHDEAQMIEIMRQLPDEDREALKRLAARMLR